MNANKDVPQCSHHHKPLGDTPAGRPQQTSWAASTREYGTLPLSQPHQTDTHSIALIETHLTHLKTPLSPSVSDLLVSDAPQHEVASHGHAWAMYTRMHATLHGGLADSSTRTVSARTPSWD